MSVLVSTEIAATNNSPSIQSNGYHNIITLKRRRGESHAKRPKAPDRQIITCYYDGVGIQLTFSISEGNGVLYVCDEYLHGGYFNIDTTNLEDYIEVGEELSGLIQIEIVTERGNTYCGMLSID